MTRPTPLFRAYASRARGEWTISISNGAANGSGTGSGTRGM